MKDETIQNQVKYVVSLAEELLYTARMIERIVIKKVTTEAKTIADISKPKRQTKRVKT